MKKHTGRVICWFSCGAASAVATKLALNQYPDAEIIYQDTGSEHSDSERFLSECEEWYGRKIKRLKSDKYTDIWDVFEKTKYLVGTNGARCTGELKRRVAENYIRHGNDLEVFGYTADERERVERFIINNNERKIWPILVERELDKTNCLALLKSAGIEIPEMYKLGYHNNNCIGCVKGGAGYWNKIRQDFPETFAKMSKLERKLNAAINKKNVNGERVLVFLDELPIDMGNHKKEINMDCGILCAATESEMQ